jgi:hypothetical protein
LIDIIEAKKEEIAKQKILEDLKEAVDDVRNNNVSTVDSLWDSIDE